MIRDGWILHPDATRVERIKIALERSGGQCPCIAQHKWNEDTVCPCLDMREGRGCHCGLYIEDK